MNPAVTCLGDSQISTPLTRVDLQDLFLLLDPSWIPPTAIRTGCMACCASLPEGVMAEALQPGLGFRIGDVCRISTRDFVSPTFQGTSAQTALVASRRHAEPKRPMAQTLNFSKKQSSSAHAAKHSLSCSDVPATVTTLVASCKSLFCAARGVVGMVGLGGVSQETCKLSNIRARPLTEAPTCRGPSPHLLEPSQPSLWWQPPAQLHVPACLCS